MEPTAGALTIIAKFPTKAVHRDALSLVRWQALALPPLALPPCRGLVGYKTCSNTLAFSLRLARARPASTSSRRVSPPRCRAATRSYYGLGMYNGSRSPN